MRTGFSQRLLTCLVLAIAPHASANAEIITLLCEGTGHFIYPAPKNPNRVFGNPPPDDIKGPKNRVTFSIQIDLTKKLVYSDKASKWFKPNSAFSDTLIKDVSLTFTGKSYFLYIDRVTGEVEESDYLYESGQFKVGHKHSGMCKRTSPKF